MPDNTIRSRVRAEYVEMPGMRLTLEQVQRLCGIERALCQTVLDALVVVDQRLHHVVRLAGCGDDVSYCFNSPHGQILQPSFARYFARMS
jgi:hypothetical protein